jgi:hypothetical protein
LLPTGRGNPLARRDRAVVVRIPFGVEAFPGAPRLFVHEGARQSLERRLTARSNYPVNLSITDNRHAIVTHRSSSGLVSARVHHMFLDAPPTVVDALARYFYDSDADASAVVGAFIDANNARLTRRSAGEIRLETKGKQHDLLAVFARLRDTYFDGAHDALVTWGRRTTPPGHKRHTIKLGSYSAHDRLIRLHPALDRRWVPRYFVEYVMFHEMLHHVMPHTRGGRRMLHPPEFLERELEFRHHDRAAAWERAHLARLLRA